MGFISIDILILNLLLAAIISLLFYIFSSRAKRIPPFITFIISCVGTFLGSILSGLIPLIQIPILNTIVVSIPGIALSLLFFTLLLKFENIKENF